MYSTRQNKVSRLIQKEIGDIFQRESNTFFPGYLVTVTVVRVTADLGLAKIYLSIFPSKNAGNVLKNIKTHQAHIRNELGKRIRNQLRIVPELNFYIDDSLDYVEKIDNLLKE
ncbi:MAG: 30S ribosome-binding factor RbfA [Bacteroidota bacterium]